MCFPCPFSFEGDMIVYRDFYLCPASGVGTNPDCDWFVTTSKGPRPDGMTNCLLTDGTLGDIKACWDRGYFRSVDKAKEAVDRWHGGGGCDEISVDEPDTALDMRCGQLYLDAGGTPVVVGDGKLYTLDGSDVEYPVRKPAPGTVITIRVK